MTVGLIDQNQTASVSEDGGNFSPEIPVKELLDRFEILNKDNEELRLLRRIYNDRDLSSIFKLSDNLDLRRAVMDQNLHSLFRLLEHHQPLIANHEDLRKAILEKNIHALFRCLEDMPVISGAEHSNLRKAIVENNLHSLFRVLEHFECLVNDVEDLRKAVMDQNLHSLFRIFQGTTIGDIDIEDLRKAVLDQHTNSLFRLFNNVDDLRKATTDQNLHSIFRLFDESEDLRKAVMDQNLHAIFRLFEPADDLRKAVIDQNLYSIFRLLDLDDHKKLVLEDNRYSMYRILDSLLPESSMLRALRYIEYEKIDFAQDCVSRGQLRSKIWLIDHLKALDLDLGCVFLCAGWYATLSAMMFEQGLKISKVRSFDVDPKCEKIAELFNKPWVVDDWKFKSTTKDIMDINYKIEEYTVRKHNGSTETLWDVPDTVINTSCEHIEKFSEWYEKMPDGVLLILQTNDFVDIDDHVNCSTTLEDFAAKTPMAECLFEGELDLGSYKRFMRIGYR